MKNLPPNFITVWLYNFFLTPLLNSHVGNLRTEMKQYYDKMIADYQERTQEQYKHIAEHREEVRLNNQLNTQTLALHERQVAALERLANR